LRAQATSGSKFTPALKEAGVEMVLSNPKKNKAITGARIKT
jgi:hypothetical protein